MSMGYVSNKITNAFYSRILKRWGSVRVKSSIWDREFSSGQWDYLDHTKEDVLYHYLEKYSNNGRILDLGCGSGNTGNEINVYKYQHYTGVDISEKAIKKAIARCKQNHRNEKNEYFCADISTYAPKNQYDLILFRESIFYIPRRKIKAMLDRYSKYLKDNGVFIVRMCDRGKYGRIVKLIETNYETIENYLADNSKDIIIIFK